MTPLRLDLTLPAGSDFTTTALVSSTTGAQLGLVGATAVLSAYVTPADAAPLFQVSTTASAAGSLVLGVTFPPPAGLAAPNGAGLEQLGVLPSVSTALPVPPVATVATLAALGALSTTAYSLGSVAFVLAGAGAYYAWSPLDPSTPNGTTIVAGVGGNWLWYSTVTVTISAASAATLAGYDLARWSLVVTFGDGEVVTLLFGRIVVPAQETPP